MKASGNAGLSTRKTPKSALKWAVQYPATRPTQNAKRSITNPRCWTLGVGPRLGSFGSPAHLSIGPRRSRCVRVYYLGASPIKCSTIQVRKTNRCKGSCRYVHEVVTFRGCAWYLHLRPDPTDADDAADDDRNGCHGCATDDARLDSMALLKLMLPPQQETTRTTSITLTTGYVHENSCKEGPRPRQNWRSVQPR